MNYEIYLDVFWVTNFVMDLLVLLIANYVKKGNGSLLRVAFASALGATGTVVFFLTLPSFFLYQLLIHVLLNPMMIAISFRVKGPGSFFRDYLLVYLLMMLWGGIMNWLLGTIGGYRHLWLWAVCGFGVCMLTVYFGESRRMEGQNYEILLQTPERKLSLKGYLDTGNLLVDPLMNQPVHIIREELLEEEVAKGQLNIRYIPYHSLGEENGLLPVVTLKSMYLKKTEDKAVSPIYIEKPVFGLTREKLFQNRDYQVILNAKCNRM